MNEEFEVILVPIKGFAFMLPDAPEDSAVEVTISYHLDMDDIVHAEAWLRQEKQKAKSYLADITSFSGIGSSEDEIENKLLAYFNTSEVFADSIGALLSGQTDYFNISDE